MTELLSAARMRAIEAAAIASGAVTGLELMERAGRGVVEAIFEEWPELAKTSHRAVVLCGPGNNGGDGFVVARLLREWGWEVEVLLYGDPEKLPPDARVNHGRWCGMGVVAALEAGRFAAVRDSLEGGGVLIDALFGTGLARPFDTLADVTMALNEAAHSSPAERAFRRFVAVDIPSGLDADSGRYLTVEDEANAVACAARANLTVTFHGAKTGHHLAAGPDACGSLRVKSIGIGHVEDAAGGETAALAGRPEPALLRRHPAAGHKYSHGHALILSGPPGAGGAARLAARGALRIGAGVVTVGCPPAALPENAARLDAVMLKPVHDADALVRILEDPRINAVALGPGLGTGEREAGLVAAALGVSAETLSPAGQTRDPGTSSATSERRVSASSSRRRGKAGRAVVLDADALTLVARHKTLFAALHDRCVLTPHAGEFARLFPDLADKLNAPATKGPAYSKLDATREAARRAGCTVLFKGSDTVIADPSGRAAVNSAHYDRAAPWLATAGSGDVLAGFIAGLLARGLAPMQAAETAAWLHVECARSFGPGLIAEDLPEELPKVFRTLGP